jgi:hypothetical protein
MRQADAFDSTHHRENLSHCTAPCSAAGRAGRQGAGRRQGCVDHRMHGLLESRTEAQAQGAGQCGIDILNFRVADRRRCRGYLVHGPPKPVGCHPALSRNRPHVLTFRNCAVTERHSNHTRIEVSTFRNSTFRKHGGLQWQMWDMSRRETRT